MKIILTTFDGHRNLLEANKYMMDRMGVDIDVIVLGFKRPDFDLGSWQFISMGEYRGPEYFTDDIKPFFDTFDDEYFIMGNDDTVLTNYFNRRFLYQIIEFVQTVPNFGRIWLTGGVHNCKMIKHFGWCGIGEIKQGANYRLSLQYSLWKTSYFKKYITPGLSPWDWELRDTAKNDGAAILCPIGNFVFSIGHIMKRGVMLPNWHKGIYGDGELSEVDRVHCELLLKKHGYESK